MKLRDKIIFITISILIITLNNIFIFTDKEYYSENEFRYLTKFNEITFDKIINRETMDNIEEYISDHYPFRESFIKIKNRFELLIGKQSINNVIVIDKYLIEQYNGFDNKDKLIDVLNTFKDNNDIDISLMLVPTSISINTNYLNKYQNTDEQINDIKYIYNNLDNINKIDVYNTLKKENKNKEMYYKTDHHWTTFGALEAYKVFSKNNENIDLRKVSSKFRGTIYSKVLISDLYDDIYIYDISDELKVTYYLGTKNDIKESVYNFSYLDSKDKYSIFLDNNKPLIKIENKSLDKDNNILVIKDSYANSFIPFLTRDYKEIHVIDPRYYNLSISEYIKKNKIKEVLFLYNMNTINDDTGIYKIK